MISNNGTRATALATTATGTTSLTVFKPTKPKLRGIRELYKHSWVPWTGREPLSKWSGLADPLAPVEPTTNQHRPSSISTTASKSQHYQTIGLTTQFEKNRSKTCLSSIYS